MSFKTSTMAAMLAVSMMGSPVLAQSAAPLSVGDRVGATTDEASELRGGFIIPLVALIAIILGIVAFSGGSDHPTSP